ncbi:antibiotic biosynthesis monooxygenase [Acidianus sulfidivorans JP7]|uniref:Antibiotic biosynthesis monooxygenase n=1 Tax=Acidianus sulfidivorans JP7 TaxID=619593 RepID=A0A2U9IPY1_9CREN|nr:antibiotic biosynthesis monooxygenase [Acidianus sulfidivorans]AWR98053.1 antibiotic biosynthesis monooxygenase [Acidianus sulfidivorans JP7]
MINVGLYYRVKPGHEEEFEKSFAGVVQFLKTHVDGFLDAKLYRSVSDPQEYMIYSEWDSLEAFRKFTLSRQFSETTEYGKTILDGVPKHRIFKELNE